MIAHGGANLLWDNSAIVGQELFEALIGKLRRGLQRFIEIVDIRRVVLGVVDLHCERVNVRLQRIIRIWQRR
jgi:hypothetical protein